jgi:hypothetical protein
MTTRPGGADDGTVGSLRDHDLSRLVPDRHLVSLPFGDREGWDWLYLRPGRPADQVLSRLGAARSRQAAEEAGYEGSCLHAVWTA